MEEKEYVFYCEETDELMLTNCDAKTFVVRDVAGFKFKKFSVPDILIELLSSDLGKTRTYVKIGIL